MPHTHDDVDYCWCDAGTPREELEDRDHVPSWSVEALQEQIREREARMSKTDTMDPRPLYQHITVVGGPGFYEVEVDEDPDTRRVFSNYNEALFHVVRFLSSCALEHGGLKGRPIHVPDDPEGVVLQ